MHVDFRCHCVGSGYYPKDKNMFEFGKKLWFGNNARNSYGLQIYSNTDNFVVFNGYFCCPQITGKSHYTIGPK